LYFEYGVDYRKIFIDDFKEVKEEPEIMPLPAYQRKFTHQQAYVPEQRAYNTTKRIVCPRCELNFILENEGFCKVCKPIVQNNSAKDEQEDYEDYLEFKHQERKLSRKSMEDYFAIRYNRNAGL
jgi:hypothetical protein